MGLLINETFKNVNEVFEGSIVNVNIDEWWNFNVAERPPKYYYRHVNLVHKNPITES